MQEVLQATQSETPAFFTVPELQKMLKIGRNNAYKLVNSYGFPSVLVGNRIVVPKDLFIVWIENQAKMGGMKYARG